MNCCQQSFQINFEFSHRDAQNEELRVRFSDHTGELGAKIPLNILEDALGCSVSLPWFACLKLITRYKDNIIFVAKRNAVECIKYVSTDETLAVPTIEYWITKVPNIEDCH